MISLRVPAHLQIALLIGCFISSSHVIVVMALRRIFTLLLVFFCAEFFSGCHPVQKSFQSGDYESAIEKAVRKIRNDATDEESIIYLEASYDKLYYQTMDHIAFLRKEGRPENTVGIYDDYSHLKLYEGMIRPLLPLYIKSKNRQAQFKFVPDEEFISAKQNAAEYLYAYANKLLGNNNRADARKAYEMYEEVKCIYSPYKDAESKQQQALEAGTNQVNLAIVNNSGAPLFGELQKQMTTVPIGDLNAEWVNFNNQNNSGQRFDYTVQVNAQYIAVTPDIQLVANTYTDKKTVQDGWDYSLDSHGNVRKDSLGNDIKKPKFKTISCIVTEYAQKKSSSISGSIDFYNDRNSALLYSFPVNIQENFENHWATASGDLNALSKESTDKIKMSPAPFPSEIDMLLKASDDLKLKLKEAVRDHIELLSVPN